MHVAAQKRRGARGASISDCIADIIVKGDLGRKDAVVLDRLMSHLRGATGHSFTKAADTDHPKPGEFIHLASRDAQAPSGIIKVLAQNIEDIGKIYAAFHGQAVQIGQEVVGIEVCNDLLLSDAGQENGARGQQ
ncbi:unnamed protein product [Prorocentrum cordatum]|uniref:Uncharacterized protein n=1 Tax=Prorocentrum cordatum TaxID=2364126 RepID=A0ABN9PN29_9DINO|nr:unnamed protein product [Polarella glacialis]